MTATKMLQTLTTRKQQAVVIRYSRRDPGSQAACGVQWPQFLLVLTARTSQSSQEFPCVQVYTRCVQMVPPGTRHQHCTSSCISLETFTCFEMCSCLKTVFMTVMTVMMQFVKFSVLQFIFYNHCDVIKVVSLSQGSYPQYQAPGAGAHRSRLH